MNCKNKKTKKTKQKKHLNSQHLTKNGSMIHDGDVDGVAQLGGGDEKQTNIKSEMIAR